MRILEEKVGDEPLHEQFRGHAELIDRRFDENFRAQGELIDWRFDESFRAQGELIDRRFDESFRAQAELIDRLFAASIAVLDRKWDAKLGEKLAPIAKDLGILREGMKIILAKLS